MDDAFRQGDGSYRRPPDNDDDDIPRRQPPLRQKTTSNANNDYYNPSNPSPPVVHHQAVEPARDPWTGFPLSVYENNNDKNNNNKMMMMQYPSSSSSSSPDADWQRDLQHLQEQVSQLGSDLSFFSSQLLLGGSGSGSSNPITPSSFWEQAIRTQMEKVREAQSLVGQQLQESIQDIRDSMVTQDTKLSYLYQTSKEQSQRLTNLSQTVSKNMEQQEQQQQRYLNDAAKAQQAAVAAARRDMEAQLQALEKRLTQQQNVLEQGTSPWDPRIQELEQQLQGQAELLNQVLLNSRSSSSSGSNMDPNKNDEDARFRMLETKLEALREELLDTSYYQPNARLDALEDRFLFEQQQQQQQWERNSGTRESDPRLAALEAKMHMQEQQVREATAAIADTRITALRAKLIEQQEELEGAVRQQAGSSSPVQNQPPTSFGNMFGGTATKESDDIKKGWSPFGDWNSGPKATTAKAVNEDTGVFSPRIPSVDSPVTFGSYVSPPTVSPEAELPPQSFSYLRAPPEEDPVGRRTVRKSISDIPPATPQNFRGYQPSPPPPPPTPPPPPPSNRSDQSMSQRNTSTQRGGGFRGNPFGRAGGVTIATEDDQKPVDVGIPRKAIAESARYDGRSQQFPPPAPPTNSARTFSDQEMWRQDSLNPDDAQRSQRRRVTSDQDRWDRDAPNPDAVRRPPIEGTRSAGRSGGVPPSDLRWNANDLYPEASVSRDYASSNGFTQSSKRAGSGGVTSDQGRLSSSTPVARDIDDMRTARPPASYARSAQRSPASPPSYPTTSGGEEDMFMKDHVMSEYMEWCSAYDKEPSSFRFQNFYQNYAEMGATRQFPVLDEFADYSKEELARMGRTN